MLGKSISEIHVLNRSLEILLVLRNNAAGAPEMQDPIDASIAEMEVLTL